MDADRKKEVAKNQLMMKKKVEMKNLMKKAKKGKVSETDLLMQSFRKNISKKSGPKRKVQSKFNK